MYNYKAQLADIKTITGTNIARQDTVWHTVQSNLYVPKYVSWQAQQFAVSMHDLRG